MAKLKQSSDTTPEVIVSQILNDCRHSVSSHRRAIIKLVECRAAHGEAFLATWVRCLQPLFLVSRKEPMVERMMKFAASFTAYWDEAHGDDCDEFVEQFMGLLLEWADATNKSVRYRACQLISEVILNLPAEITVDDELWDSIISSMQKGMMDSVTSVRVYAARALSRLVIVDESDNDKTVSAYRQALECDSAADVRKMVVMSMPAMNVTVADIVARTADISEAVRKETYHVLGSKFCLQSLSIMQRALVLQRGLGERSIGVRTECVAMLKTAWLEENCEGNVLSLLRCLDVETHEKVGEKVMLELFNTDRYVKANRNGGLRQFIRRSDEDGQECGRYKLLDAEQAFYWRMLCSHLHALAEAQGLDAAATGGAEAVVKAAAAAESNDDLDDILPSTITDFVLLIEAHVRGGPTFRFAARQLLSIFKLVNFTDNTLRSQASAMLQRLLNPEVADQNQDSLTDGVGDGLSIAGDELWTNAIADVMHHVHSSPGEFAAVVTSPLAVCARPCREGEANTLQWLHCLAVTGLLLGNISSLRELNGQVVEAHEILDSLLMPAVKNLHPEVQRAGVRCLGIFCCLQTTPSARAIEQLKSCVGLNDRYYVQEMALKALFDLILRHGFAVCDQEPGERDQFAMLRQTRLHISDIFRSIGGSSDRGPDIILRAPLSELLAALLDSDDAIWGREALDLRIAVVAEGFVKVVLQKKYHAEIEAMRDGLFDKMIRFYFSEDTQKHTRLRQTLNVFFRTYCSQAANNKRTVSRVFVSVMRKEWPGIEGNQEKLKTAAAARKHASELGKYMLLLLQLPLTAGCTEGSGKTSSNGTIHDPDEILNEGHEELAIRICAEVISYPSKRSMAGKQYTAALLKYCTQLRYRACQRQEVICLQQILPAVLKNLTAGEKSTVKELQALQKLLNGLVVAPRNVSVEDTRLMMERLGVENYIGEVQNPIVEDAPLQTPAIPESAGRKTFTHVRRSRLQTPVPPSTRTLRKRPESTTIRQKHSVVDQPTQNGFRKNLSTLYDSDNPDFDSESSVTSSSGSEFEG